MIKKVFLKRLLALLVLLSMVTLSGCSVFLVEGGYIIDKSNQEEKVRITYSWWGTDERHVYMMEGVENFNNKSKEIYVECRYGDWNGYEKKTQVYMMSNSETDVMQVNFNWLSKYSEDGNGYYNLYDLEEYVDLSNFSQKDLQMGEIDGKLNALPCAYNTAIMFINKSVYNELGVEIPTTWEGFFEAAPVFREKGIYQLSVPSNKMLFFILISYYEQTTGKASFSEHGDLLLKEEDIHIMIEFYERLIDEKVLCPMDKFSMTDITDEKIAGIISWATDASKYGRDLTEKGREIYMDTLPVFEGAKRSGKYIKPATMYTISNDTDNPVEAAQFLDYLVNSSEMALIQGTEKGIPVSENAAKTLTENGVLDDLEYMAYKVMMDDREDTNSMISIIENTQVIKAVKQEMDLAIYDEISSEECASILYKEIREIVDTLQ